MDQQLPIKQTNDTDVFSSVYTKEDLLLFYKEIDQIMTDMFRGNGDFEATITNILSPEKKLAVLRFLTENNVHLKNPVEVKVALSKIQRMGNILPTVSLTLAIEPTTPIIKNISSWFTKQYNRKVILDFTLERRAIGGAYISHDGLYKDYTLQTKVEKYFEKGAAVLPYGF